LPTDKIKRNFVWLRKVLGIIDKTTLPGEILGDVRPTMDLFGWDRLGEVTSFSTSFSAAPANSTAGAITPEGFLRCYFSGGVRHTDVGVDHFLWIEKIMPDAAQVVELTPATVAVPVTVPQALDRWVFCEAGARLRGRAGVNLVAGAIAMNLNFVDLPIGEYILR